MICLLHHATSAKRGRWEESRRLWLGRDRLVGGLKKGKWIAPPSQMHQPTYRLENGVAYRALRIRTMEGMDAPSRVIEDPAVATYDSSSRHQLHKDHDDLRRTTYPWHHLTPAPILGAVRTHMATVSFDCSLSSRSALRMVRPGLAIDGCWGQYRR